MTETTWDVICPNCGKERKTTNRPSRQKGESFSMTHFCDLKCERNFRYRQNRRNVSNRPSKSAEEAGKWDV